MDKKKLKQIRYLIKEIDILKSKMESIEDCNTIDSVKGSTRFFPYIETNFKIEGIDYDFYIKKVKRIRKVIKNKMFELTDIVEETIEYINNIDDSLIRQAITLKYLDGLSWEQVASRLGNNSADNLRKMIDRFIDKNK